MLLEETRESDKMGVRWIQVLGYMIADPQTEATRAEVRW